MSKPKQLLLNGWDTANAATFDVVNQAIKKQGKTPKNFSQSAGKNGLPELSNGKWKDWSLLPGGSGAIVKMACPIKSGACDFIEDVNVYTFDSPTELDSGTKGNVTLSNNDLTATAVPGGALSDFYSAFAKIGHKSGKFYFEITKPTGSNQVLAGLCHAAAPKDDFSKSPTAYAYHSNGFLRNDDKFVGFKVGGGTSVGGAKGEVWNTLNNSETIGIAVDLDEQKIWFRGTNGSWQGENADPAAGTGSAFTIDTSQDLYAAVAVGFDDTITVNYGSTAFVHSVPTGFMAGWGSVKTSTKQKKRSLDLSDAEVHVEVKLAQVAAAANQTDLMVDDRGSNAEPAVTIVSTKIKNATNMQNGFAGMAFSQWFNANIGKFNNVFHSVDLNSKLAKGEYGWLSSTKIGYAVADLPGQPSNTNSVFSVLSITDTTPVPTNLALQVDPNIIAGMPPSANSVLGISAEKFAQQILVKAAVQLMTDAKEADFEIVGDGLVVTNKKDLAWREIKLADNCLVTPVCPKHGLKVRVEGNKIQVEFSGLHFDYPGWTMPGEDVVTIGFKQAVHLDLKRSSDGKHFLFVKNQDPNAKAGANSEPDTPNITDITIVPKLNSKAQTFEEAMQITTIALSVLTLVGIGFSAGSWIIRSKSLATAVSQGTQDVLNGTSNSVQMAEIVYSAVPDLSNVVAGEEAAAIAQATANMQSVTSSVPATAGGVMFITKFAIGCTIVAALAGLSAAAFGITYGISQTQKINKDDPKELVGVNKQLSVEKFLENFLTQFKWPESPEWILKEVHLAQSLLFYGKLEDPTTRMFTMQPPKKSKSKRRKGKK